MTDFEDREQIVEALAQLAAALDRRDWESVAAAFLPDARAYADPASTRSSPSYRRIWVDADRRSTYSATTA